MAYFNDLNFKITEDTHPSAIYERTKENPNERVSAPCNVYTGSLDQYASKLLGEMFSKKDGTGNIK